MRQLSPLDCSYLAALVDGEGCITIVRSRKHVHQNWHYSVQTTVTNTNEELLDWCRDSTRLGTVSPNATTNTGKRKLAFRWWLRSYEMTEFLVAIRPFLKIKGRQADIVLEFIRNTRNSGPALTEFESESKLDLYHEIRALNERGAQ